MWHGIRLIGLVFLMTQVIRLEGRPVSSGRKKQTSQNYSHDNSLHVIGPWPYGFFSAFLGVLNNLAWCDKNNKIPIVYWNERSLYYVSGGFNGSQNAWEYYFEPVSPYPYSPNIPMTSSYWPSPNNAGFSPLYYNIDDRTRTMAHAIIQKYVRVNAIVQQKIDRFHAHYMSGKKIIAIHLRGTDKWTEQGLVGPEKMVQAALQYADANTYFLLASDEQRLLNRMITLLAGRKIFYYDCYRSDNGKPLHSRTIKPSPAQLGEDVLVEAVLFSKCDLFVHTLSNVSTASLFMNPGLRHVTVK